MSLGLIALLACFGYIILFGMITVTIMIIIAKDRALRAEADGNLKEIKLYWFNHDTFEYIVLYDSCRDMYIPIYILLWPLIAIIWIVKSIVAMPYKISCIFMKDRDRYIKTKRKDPEFEE